MSFLGLCCWDEQTPRGDCFSLPPGGRVLAVNILRVKWENSMGRSKHLMLEVHSFPLLVVRNPALNRACYHFILFLATQHGMWDLSSPTRIDPCSGVLTTGLPEKSSGVLILGTFFFLSNTLWRKILHSSAETGQGQLLFCQRVGKKLQGSHCSLKIF